MFRTRKHLYQESGVLHRDGHKSPALWHFDIQKVSLHIVKEKLSKTLAKLKPVIISAVSYLA